MGSFGSEKEGKWHAKTSFYEFWGEEGGFGLVSLQLMGAVRLCDAHWCQPADIWMNNLTQNPKSGI